MVWLSRHLVAKVRPRDLWLPTFASRLVKKSKMLPKLGTESQNFRLKREIPRFRSELSLGKLCLYFNILMWFYSSYPFLPSFVKKIGLWPWFGLIFALWKSRIKKSFDFKNNLDTWQDRKFRHVSHLRSVYVTCRSYPCTNSHIKCASLVGHWPISCRNSINCNRTVSFAHCCPAEPTLIILMVPFSTVF